MLEMLQWRGPTQQTRCSREASTSVCEDHHSHRSHVVSSGCRHGRRILCLDLRRHILDRRIRHLWVLPVRDCYQ